MIFLIILIFFNLKFDDLNLNKVNKTNNELNIIYIKIALNHKGISFNDNNEFIIITIKIKIF